MAYDEGLAQRIQEVLGDQPGLVEKKMFGGVGFLLHGNMAVGVSGHDLMVRVGPQGHEAALARPHARAFDLTGKPMKGWLLVSPEGYEADADLQSWMLQGLEFARSLPAK